MSGGEFKKAELGQIVWWESQLHEVLSLGDGRTVTLKPIHGEPCPACGSDQRVALLEHSPLFQAGVSPVLTINGARGEG